jgi:hypothetical protein
MADNRNHMWQDKLSQVPLPDESESWGPMKSKLDEHLPVQQRHSGKALVVGALLLLFVIGICTCPAGRNKGLSDSVSKQGTSNTNTSSAPSSVGTTPLDTIQQSIIEPSTKRTIQTPATQYDNEVSTKLTLTKPTDTLPLTKGGSNKTSRAMSASTSFLAVSSKSTSSRAIRKSLPGHEKEVQSVSKPVAPELISQVEPLVSSDTIIIKSVQEYGDTTVKRDTVITTENLASPPSVDSGFRKLWTLGIGFNHIFAIGQQEWTSINNKATYTGWHQWLPVLTARYYMKEQLFLQAEIQFNAPQYTPNILLSQTVSPMPGQNPGPAAVSRIERSMYAKKLFYLDVPLSLHFRAAPHFFIGAGVQYSRLQQAIGLYEEKRLTTGQPDSLLLRRYQRLDNTSSLHKQEWRYLMSAATRVKRFDAGIRYTRSFRSFATESVNRNSTLNLNNQSLLLFVRYEFLRAGNRYIKK